MSFASMVNGLLQQTSSFANLHSNPWGPRSRGGCRISRPELVTYSILCSEVESESKLDNCQADTVGF